MYCVITIITCALALASFGRRVNYLPVHCRDDWRGSRRHSRAIRIIRLPARGRPSSSSPLRHQVLSSAYVVQIDSSRESLYLMRLPNGVRLKRCSHHRRKSPPRRLQPSSIFVSLLCRATDEKKLRRIILLL